MPSCAMPGCRSKSSRPTSTSGRSSGAAPRATQARSPRCSRAKRRHDRGAPARPPGAGRRSDAGAGRAAVLQAGGPRRRARAARRTARPHPRASHRGCAGAGRRCPVRASRGRAADHACVFGPFPRSLSRCRGRDAVTASVGGYQLEKAGIQLFERIEGDHFVILGLPLLALLQISAAAGWLAA